MFRKHTTPIKQQSGLASVVFVSLLIQCGLGDAAEPPSAARYSIEQPSQALDESLRAIARQTSTSVIFDPGAVQGRVAQPVSGNLSAIEAINAALKGTGLSAEVTKEGVVVVRPLVAPAATSSGPAGSAAASISASGVDEHAGPKTRENLEIAASSNDEGSAATPDPRSEVPESLTKVEVTGSRLKRVAAEGPAPVNVYTKEDIEKSGQPTLDRFLASLNEVSASAGEGSFATTLGQGTVQLRGLPLGTTLVLINGRRIEAMGSSSGNFFNLNLIPMAAVDRIEIVPVGSSAVYGGDALAGVVNVILKKSIDGQSLMARAGTGRGFSDAAASLATGGHNANGSYLVMGSYSRSTPLTMAERGFFTDADYRRFGGADARVRNCTPGTVTSLSSANLPGLTSTFAGVPQLAAGQVPTVADFRGMSGSANLCNVFANGNGYALAHGDETFGLQATGEHNLVGSWSVFAELTLANERTKARDSGLSLSGVVVPASNPFNPFGRDVSVTTILGPDNGLRGLARQTRFTRALVGMRGDLAGDWDAEVTASTTRDTGGTQTFGANTDTAARTAALAATTPAAALNPFSTGRAASDAVLQSIWSDTLRDSYGRKDQIGGLVRGTVLKLPAGPLEAILGAESARDRYDVTITRQLDTHDSRTESATYGELRAPLLSAGPAGKGWPLAALTLAARRDHYSDFGAATTYQTGLEVRPSRSLLIRASGAGSFKPPTMLQTHIDDIVYDASTFNLKDPARGGEAITSGTVIRTTNEGLQPEHGRSTGFGAVWEPEGSMGTKFGLTHWQVHIHGLISVLPAQTALDNEALFPGFVTRGPSMNGQPGPVTNIKLAEANIGSVNVAGTDLDAAYAWKSPLGRWLATAGATRTSDYQVVLAQGAAPVDRLGRRFTDFWAPRWKGRLSLGLDQGSWSLGLTSRYLGHYKDIGTSNRRLGGYWMHDLAGTLDLKKWWPGLGLNVKAATLSLSVANLGDREPEYVSTAPYFDITQSDWRGRYTSVKLSVDW